MYLCNNWDITYEERKGEREEKGASRNSCGSNPNQIKQTRIDPRVKDKAVM